MNPRDDLWAEALRIKPEVLEIDGVKVYPTARGMMTQVGNRVEAVIEWVYVHPGGHSNTWEASDNPSMLNVRENTGLPLRRLTTT